MARYGRLLTDAQWAKIQPLLPKRPPRPRGGRPPANDRKVLEGILWILRSGARWQDMPEEFPSPSTCCDDWTGRARDLLRSGALSGRKNERQQLSGQGFWTTVFAPARGLESEKPSRTRGRSGWWWSTARVFQETTFTLLRRRFGWRRPRWRRSAWDAGIARPSPAKAERLMPTVARQ
jgi:transposase